MVDRIDKSPATEESVWAAFRETDRLRKEADARWESQFEKEKAEWRAKFDESKNEFDRRAKKLDEQIGGISNSQGMFAEDFFFNSLDNSDKKLFGEQFDSCHNHKFHDKKKHKKGQFDVVLVNGKTMALIEVKFKARKKNIHELIDKVADFKEYFPLYQSHQLYLGIAAMTFEDDVEKESLEHGIAIFKQIGETVEIYDQNLKVF